MTSSSMSAYATVYIYGLELLWNVQYAIRILDSNSPLELAESHMRLRLAVGDK